MRKKGETARRKMTHSKRRCRYGPISIFWDADPQSLDISLEESLGNNSEPEAFLLEAWSTAPEDSKFTLHIYVSTYTNIRDPLIFPLRTYTVLTSVNTTRKRHGNEILRTITSSNKSDQHHWYEVKISGKLYENKNFDGNWTKIIWNIWEKFTKIWKEKFEKNSKKIWFKTFAEISEKW